MKRGAALCVLILLGGSLRAQQGDGAGPARQASNTAAGLGASAAEANRNIMLARSSADYRVTPGDVYTLAYAAGSAAVTYVITVDSTYRIRVSNLGVINGAGKTFVQVKGEAEAAVMNNYPLSGVQLVLTQPAVFLVKVKGEVHSAGEAEAWGLSRLSSLARDEAGAAGGRSAVRPTAYASLRDVAVRSQSGQVRVYDLFRAERYGDLTQDPHLRPGDEITFGRAERTVWISGEVERPGSYQLLAGENLRELAGVYGGGFTRLADVSRAELVRTSGDAGVTGSKIFLGAADFENNYELRGFDAVHIPPVTELLPVLFVEGALKIGKPDEAGKEESAELSGTTRAAVTFTPGEDYAALARRNRGWFGAESDTAGAYIIRRGERIMMNLNPMLYDAGYRREVLIEGNDVLVVPFRQYFVTVAGAVERPGRYPYIPDREWDYYIGLAGGFVAGRNDREAVDIRDLAGKRHGKEEAVTPETVITALSNGGLYYFNQYAPVVTTALTVITTLLTAILLFVPR